MLTAMEGAAVREDERVHDSGTGRRSSVQRSLSIDASCQLHVAHHDCHALGVNRTQIRVFMHKHHRATLRASQQRSQGKQQANVISTAVPH